MIELPESMMEAKAPTMMPPITQEAPRIRRVQEPDLEMLARWLLPRFKETGYPDLIESSVVGWLRSAMGDRNSLLVRAEHAVALYTASSNPLEPRLTVTETWARMVHPYHRTKPDSVICQVDLTEIRLFALAWARSVKARRLILDADSDMPIEPNSPVPRLTADPNDMERRRQLVVEL